MLKTRGNSGNTVSMNPAKTFEQNARSAYLTGFYALAWADWLACDNPYAQGDRAAIAAGALEYLNTIAITLRKL